MSLNDRAAKLLSQAMAAYEHDLDWGALPSQSDVAEAIGIGKRKVYSLPAWREYWKWKQELPLPPCRVCGESSEMRKRQMCHTHGERWRRWGSPEPWQDWADALRENRLNTCEMCGVEFNGAQGVVRFCDPCREQRHRRQALDHWYNRTPAERQEATARSKQLARERRERNKTVIECAICGKKFRDHQFRVFCGAECRNEAQNRQRREIRRRVRLLELMQQHNEIMEKLADDDRKKRTD